MDFTLTPAARKFISRMLRFSPTPEGGFRLLVKPGGCSGVATEFSVEEAPLEGDRTFVKDGVRLFLPAESRLFLQGATVDFADTALESGFVVASPAAPAGSCSTDSHAHHAEPVQLVQLGPMG